MLTKLEMACPMGAIRHFSAISKGLNAVLRNFHLEVAVRGEGPWSLKKRKLQLRKVIC